MKTKYHVALISLLLSNAAAQTALTFTGTLLLLPAIARAGVNAWTSLGPGGMSIDGLAIDPQDPATIYAWKIAIPIGGTGLSVFGRLKSTDAGMSWRELPASGAGPLAIDPANTGTLYAADGHTVLKSQDGGASWNSASAGLPQRCASVLSLSIDLQNTDRIYASFNSFDNFCEAQNTGGTWGTSDGGTSWMKLGQQPKGGGVHGIAIDPQDSSILYGWNGMGIFKSTDRGASWNALNSGLPTRVNNPPQSQGVVNVVVIDPQSPSTLYAVLSGDGIFKSTDGGAGWVTANSGLPATSVNGRQNYAVTSLVIDPDHPDTLYANGDGVLRSTDGGATWSSVGTGLTTFFVYTLAIDPHDTRTVYAGTADGVFAITFSPDE
jgi:hypothetical protein